MKIHERKAIQWAQLCAIAKDRLEMDPTQSDADWKESIKLRATSLGYQDPTSEQAHKAMDAIERTMRRPRKTLPTEPTSEPRDPTTDPARARALVASIRSRGLPMPGFLQTRSRDSAHLRPRSTRPTIALTSPGWAIVDGQVRRVKV